ncbi:Uncharacterised protein [Mycobacteroides abscessus]|nr:Uncharacterised protein [Mycobacteroides abscessus]
MRVRPTDRPEPFSTQPEIVPVAWSYASLEEPSTLSTSTWPLAPG